MPREVMPQIEKERRRVVAARRVAGAQPQWRHQPHLAQDREQRMQTGLEAEPRVAGAHAVLMTVLVQQPRRIEIERVAALARGQPVQTPSPQRTETRQVFSRRSETTEETRQGRGTGDPLNAEHLWHHRITPKISDMRELARLA